jgi:DNA-binding transcriptional regulator LsrR (DeoR family)
MSSPAFVKRMVEAAIHKKNPQVKKVLDKAADCAVYVTGMGPVLAPDPARADHTSTRLVNDDAMFSDKLARLAAQEGAVAEICYCLVDANGNEVEADYEAIGIGFKKLRAAAANRNKRVILVTGGDNRRFEPLRAILKARLANVLITDATTAQKLIEK